MPEAFVPVYTPDPALRTAQQRLADSAKRTPKDPSLRNKPFTAAAGGVYRVSSTGTVDVTLPVPTAALFDERISLYLEAGSMRVVIPGESSTTISTAGLYIFGCSP